MRSPRRSFAAPFVVTLVGAAASAGFTSCNPPAQRQPPMNPPDPGPGSATADNAGSGSDQAAGSGDPDVGPGDGSYTTEPPAKQDGETRWHVSRMGDHCMAALDVDCPAPVDGKPVRTCNPPPPVKYACPENVTAEHAIVIGRYKDAKACYVVPEAWTCPGGAICNPPPPPADITCPTR